MKKIVIALCAIVLCCTLSVCAAGALTPPRVYSDAYYDIGGSPSRNHAEALMELCELQEWAGSFNNLTPVLCYKGSTTNTLILVLADSGSRWQTVFTEAGGVQVNAEAGARLYRMVYTVGGFGFQQQWSPTVLQNSLVLFYAYTSEEELTINDSFAFGTDGPILQLANDLTKWRDYKTALLNYEENLRSEYENGLSEGYEVGYTAGYNEGVQNRPTPEDIIFDVNIGEVISGITATPQSILGNAFDFTLFGINIAGLLGAIAVVLILGFIIGKAIKHG